MRNAISDYGRAIDYTYKALKAADNLKKNSKGHKLFVALIYNSLGTIFLEQAEFSISNYVLNNDLFTADRYLAKFASLMRAILANSDRKEVPLAEDMETLELYRQLESMRLDHRFTYQINIEKPMAT